MRILSELLHNRVFLLLIMSNFNQRLKKNFLDKAEVLALLSFNVYTNNQPGKTLTRFIYADDLALASETPFFDKFIKKLKCYKCMYNGYLQITHQLRFPPPIMDRNVLPEWSYI